MFSGCTPPPRPSRWLYFVFSEQFPTISRSDTATAGGFSSDTPPPPLPYPHASRVIYNGAGVTDVHRFSYIGRKSLWEFSPKVKDMLLDFAFVLEGHDDSELPERVLACFRLNGWQFDNAPEW